MEASSSLLIALSQPASPFMSLILFTPIFFSGLRKQANEK